MWRKLQNIEELTATKLSMGGSQFPHKIEYLKFCDWKMAILILYLSLIGLVSLFAFIQL